MLGDENQFMIAFEIHDDFCGFAFEDRHEFSLQDVTL